MNNIYGPISLLEWTTLLKLKNSIEYMKKTNYSKYKVAIDKETKLYKYFLPKVS